MGEIILSQSDIEVEHLHGGVFILCIITLLLAWMCCSYVSNGFKNGFTGGDLSMIVFSIVLTGVSLWGAYVMIEHSQKRYIQQDTIAQAHSKVPYYDLKKDGILIIADGKAIKFTLKDSKSEYLQKQAEARIIDEDSKTYQVQYKDTIDRVPKSAVK